MALLPKLLPMGWPYVNLSIMLSGPPKLDKPAAEVFKNKPVADTLEDHIGVQASTIPKLVVAALVFTLTAAYNVAITSSNGRPAPAATLSLDWMLPVIMRDLIITILTAGVWDFLLYSVMSPFRERMKPYKFNPVYPKPAQLTHDMMWALCSTVISSLMECAVLYAYATGRAALHMPTWYTDVGTLAWLLSMPYWRLAHFWCIHRGMHPWRTTVIPDVGKFLYKHVHSLHHLSRNPTSWSGISMHPVESSTYYTAMLIPVLFGAHPIVMLYTKFDLTMAALIGHDGFGYPGAGSNPHWIHHNVVECNYGENYAPLDWLLGTWAGSEEEFMQLKWAGEAKKEASRIKTVNHEEEPSSEKKAAPAAVDAPSSGGARKRSTNKQA